jgi:hypothetical protein
MSPQRFIVTVTPSNETLFSFFLDCDPGFSAVIFTLGREYFGDSALIADSFLYREDGTICLLPNDDFPAVYIDYLQSVLRRARGVVSDTKRNRELN